MGNSSETEMQAGKPSAFYRSAPFWAWNDSLDPDELKRQVREMKNQGMGGFIIHSREGLETEYLSEEWMACVRETLEEADRQGMEAWIYDEDKWPSGSAGGLVSTVDPHEFTAKAVTAELLTRGEYEKLEPEGNSHVLGCYSLKLSKEGTLRDFTLLGPAFPAGEDGPVLVCREEISGPSEWYNNLAPPDNLNPRSVRCFLDMTHEKYRDRFDSRFGKTVRGFFTDEPNFCDFFSRFTPGRPWVPWSSVIPPYFLEKRGYSPLEILPFLFFQGPGASKGRHDYWLTLTELFQTSYMKQIYEWCDRNRLELTGHVLYENDLGYSVRVSGAAMPHYRYMHAPGIDLLGDTRREYLTVKQCTSVANQFGRKTVFTETYGTTGWEFDFAGQKRVGDWQFVMGVNKRCQHLALYSFSGCRKRDYPPSFNYHNNWWPHNHIMEDYFARLSESVSLGEVQREILLIHPIGTYWMKSGSDMQENLDHMQMNMGWLDSHILNLNKEGDVLNRLARDLLMAQFDFDFGDEMIMGEDARISGNEIIVGRQSYSTVIVPPVETLLPSTVALLKEFIRTGGRIYWVGDFPEKINALSSEYPKEIRENSISAKNFGELLSLLRLNEERPLKISDDVGEECDGFLSMVRRDGLKTIITLVNTEDRGIRDVRLRFSTRGKLTALDLFSGEQEDLTVSLPVGEEGMILQTTFKPEETKVLMIDSGRLPQTGEVPFPYRHPHYVTNLILGFPARTEIELSRENTLTLDRCRFRLGKEDWREEALVWQGQKAVREELHMRPVYYNGAPQRYSWLNRPASKKTVPLTLRFSFHVDAVPPDPIFAAVEKSEDFTIKCNGLPCLPTEEFFLDKALLKHRLPGVKRGENILEIKLDYHEGIELEDIYLTGRFGVGNDRKIGHVPDSLLLGDWTWQGLYHYGGNVIYRFIQPPLAGKSKNRLLLRIGRFSGTLALVRINGGDAVPLLRGNEDVDVTERMYGDRENLIEIEIVGNLRNMMGPFHKNFVTCSRISWEDFRTEGPLYTDEYRVHPFGLFDVPAIVESAD